MVDGLPAPIEALSDPPDDGELGWLWRARREGAVLAPMVVVPAAVEAGYYRLNNLPERLRALFEGIDLADPDEDDLEELAPPAEALVRGHALLDEVIETLYLVLAPLPTTLRVRRSGTEGELAARGRPVLLALKRRWAEDWRSEALAERLLAGRGLAPEATPIAIHDADLHPASPPPGSEGRIERAWVDGEGRLARVSLAAVP